ncbi:glycosyltransferase [Sphingobium scionense]
MEKKGVNYLLDAWAQLPARARSEPLTIIGDGPLMPTLVERARQLDIKPTFLGARSRAEVFAAMASHRIFAMPSIRAANGDSEGLPIVLMEAQGMGMAIVAFDDGPMREAIKPGLSGLLARSRSVEDFADHLRTLLLAPDLCEDFGKAGRNHVATQFDLRHRVAALEDYYDEILATTGARS